MINNKSINPARLLASLRTLEFFTNHALNLKDHTPTLNGFYYNRELLKAAAYNTYVETVSNKSDSLYLAIEKSDIYKIRDSLFDKICRITKPFSFQDQEVILALDYTSENFYGDADNFWIHGWTGENGVTGKYSYLTVSMITNDLRLPLISIPSPIGNNKASEIVQLIKMVRAIVPNIKLVLFDRGFYDKEVMSELNKIKIAYLILVPKNNMIKTELESMNDGERKIKIYEFEYYKDKNKVVDNTYLAFLKHIFDGSSENYYDWSFATNLAELDLSGIIKTYKLRWNIETHFRVQDECKIKTKSKDIKVRYYLFSYEQLIESIWYLFNSKETSFKRFLIELSDECIEVVSNEEKKRADR